MRLTQLLALGLFIDESEAKRLSDESCSGDRCSGYRGQQNLTKGGNTCQKWTSQSPNAHQYSSEKYPNNGLGDHNYCRNFEDGDTIWCYTTNPNVRWEYCEPIQSTNQGQNNQGSGQNDQELPQTQQGRQTSLTALPQAPEIAIEKSNNYDADYNELALQGHNTYRRAHQACDMKFSSSAAATAQKWAEYLNANGKMEHSSGSQRNNCGENIAMHSNTNLLSTTNVATEMWYDEVTEPGYNFQTGGFSSGTGHFTQVVWKGSTELGCGIAGAYVVCQYCKEAGNMMGAFQRNVLPKGPQAQCDAQTDSTTGSNGTDQTDSTTGSNGTGQQNTGSNGNKNVEICTGDRCSGYRGKQNVTKSGKTCQKWTSQSPNEHTRTPENYPDSGLGDHNYCRNPDDEDTIWCYTTDPNKRWEYCEPIQSTNQGQNNQGSGQNDQELPQTQQGRQTSLTALPQAPEIAIEKSNNYDADYNELALQGHNTYRRAHQACDMKFSSSAAATAQKWAEYLNANGKMEHSSGSQRNNCGENIAMHSNTNLLSTTNVATEMWYDEVTEPGYNFQTGGFSSGTGHFTQVVWKGSTELGCGIAGAYVVCQYCKEAGNMMGAFQKNVLPKGPQAQCDAQTDSTTGSNGTDQTDSTTSSNGTDQTDSTAGSNGTDQTEYRGKQNMTKSGKTCQKWTSQSPHEHTRTPENYPDSGLGDHNYCRNPDNETTIWCYTTSDVRWEYCDPIKKDQNVKRSVEVEQKYETSYPLTQSGMSCEGSEQGQNLGVFGTAKKCEAAAMDAGCNTFMHMGHCPRMGCRCCKSLSGLTKHNLWDVYHIKNTAVKSKQNVVSNENTVTNYPKLHSGMECLGQGCGKNLGNFETAKQCEVAAMNAGCDTFMHNDLYASWGCRCCKKSSSFKKHYLWNVYQVNKNEQDNSGFGI